MTSWQLYSADCFHRRHIFVQINIRQINIRPAGCMTHAGIYREFVVCGQIDIRPGGCMTPAGSYGGY